MKRKMLAGWTALLMLLTLTACGSSTKNQTSSSPMASDSAAADTAYGGDIVYEEAESQPYETDSNTEEAGADAGITQKLICTAHLEMETLDFDATVSALTDLTEQYGGYYENTTVYSRGSGYRSADYTIRVPSAHYPAFLNQAGELCHETWRSTEQEDVTEFYYDTEGRLKTQQIKLERLQELLSKAEKMEDIITIETAISETEWEIEELSGTLRHYDYLVDYATVTINLNEVYKLSNVEEAPDSFGARMGNAFTGGLQSFGNTVEDLAVAFAYSWIWWLLLVVVVVIVVRVVRRKKLPKLSLGKKKGHDKENET